MSDDEIDGCVEDGFGTGDVDGRLRIDKGFCSGTELGR
jgi:hypothetical protein